MKKNIAKRIRITKSGKVMRRTMGQGHNRSKRTGSQARRKLGNRGLIDAKRIMVKYH